VNVTTAMGRAITTAENAAPQLKKLHDAAEQVESYFVKNLLTEMQKGQDGGLFGKTPGSEIYQDMFTQSIADQVAKSGSFGIAKSLEQQVGKQLLREAASPLSTSQPERAAIAAPTGKLLNNQERK